MSESIDFATATAEPVEELPFEVPATRLDREVEEKQDQARRDFDFYRFYAVSGTTLRQQLQCEIDCSTQAKAEQKCKKPCG
jgi:hypothetical protein